MEEIVNKELCSGCAACYNACPVQSISMKPDSEGFLFPEIDAQKCIDCGLCKRICPILNNYVGNPKGTAYACINKDEFVRNNSSSGGFFSLVAENVINKNGVVFGAALDKNANVEHICISEKSQLSKLRGSKYLQSVVGDSYKKAEAFLKDDKYVLFSGTPCQISGLKSFLGKDYEKLILVDFICHGVPSQKAWAKYLEYQKKKYKAKTVFENEVNFRDKSSGWTNYSMRIKFDNKDEYIGNLSQDLFMRSFLNNLCLRKSCYNCHSKSVNRESDITMADFWGVKDILPEMFDDKGTSLILINSAKGKKIFEELAGDMNILQVDFEKAISRNTAAYKSCELPKNREKFMASLDKIDFEKNIKSCIKSSMIIKIKRFIKRGIKYVQK